MRASGLLDQLTLSRPRRRTVSLSAPWGARIPSGGGCPGVYLVASGSATVTVDGLAPVTLEAGDVAVLPRGTPHAIASAPDVALQSVDEFCGTVAEAGADYLIGGGGGSATELRTLCFDVATATQRAALAFAPRLAVVRAREARPWVMHVARATVELFDDGAIASDAARRRLGEVLLMEALAGNLLCPTRGNDPAMLRAALLLRDNLEANWTATKLARRVGVSRSALYARFVRAVGASPSAYLLRARMQQATTLLETGASIDDVARRVGYTWPSSFTIAFRRFHGVLPSAYQRAKSE